jgi:hypothetical protein
MASSILTAQPGASLALHQAGLSGSHVVLERTDMTKRQQEIFKIFEKAVVGIKPKMDDKKRQEILDVIKEVPINVSNPSEHADKTTIVTMMIAFEVLEKAHGNAEEFKEAMAAVKEGFYYFTPSDKEPVQASLHAKKGPSPTDEKKIYDLKLAKDNIAKLYEGLKEIEAPIVTLEQALDFNQFHTTVVSLVDSSKQLTKDAWEKARKDLHAKIDYLKTLNLGVAVDKALDTVNNTTNLVNLEALAKTLNPQFSTPEATAPDTKKADQLLNSIQQAIIKKMGSKP